MSTRKSHAYDVFISYRWVSPDREWVREQLYPRLVDAGLKVCLDVEDFIPGRDLILEMERVGKNSRHAICVLSPDYFAGNRIAGFESLMLRRSDPSGKKSRLIPLVLRPAKLPDRIVGLIPIDWTDANYHQREWRKLLRVLKAKNQDVPPPGALECVSRPPEAQKGLAISSALPDTSADLAKACKNQIKDEIRAVVGDKYIPSLYIDRSAHELIKSFILKRPSAAQQFIQNALAAVEAIKADVQFQEDRIKLSVITDSLKQQTTARQRKEELTPHDIELLKALAKTRTEVDSIVPLLESLRDALANNNSMPKVREILEQLETHPGCIGEVRTSIEDAIHTLKNCLLIRDVAGRGKTNLVCALASEIAKEQPTILIIAGALRVEDKFSLERYIQASLGYSGEMAAHLFMTHILNVVKAADEELLIIIDAINENRDTHLLKTAIQSFLTQYRDHNLKCIVTCRDIYWDGFLHSEGDFWENFLIKQIELGDFTDREFSRALPLYFKRFKISADLSAGAIQKLKHPLLLRFFCEAHRGTRKVAQLGQIKDIRLKPLFDTYWQKKVAALKDQLKHRDVTEIKRFILLLARKMRFNRDRNLSLEDITRITDLRDFETTGSVYTRVLDESIILEQIPEESRFRRRPRVTFVYDEFMEYVMARDLMEHTMNTQNTAKLNLRFGRLLRSAHRFNSIYGVVTYLLLMLEEEQNFDGWDQVFNRGEQWYLPLCKSLSRVMPENLSSNAIMIANKLAQVKDDRILDEIAEIAEELSRAQPEKAIVLWRTLIKGQLKRGRRIARDSLVWLSRDGNKEALEVLGDCLRSGDHTTRATAVYALAEAGHLRPKQIRDLSHDRTSFVREAALFAVTRLNPLEKRDCEKVIKRALFDKTPEIRVMAVRVIKEEGWADLRPILQNVYSTERDPLVKETIAESLIAMKIDEIRAPIHIGK